ncbi:hypothetical protein HN789_07405 [archaeon]|jgi:hypothetical protein|nr:hypothetical protein [archaeon]MBT4273145.1 hypothetical protein [archaeon]MBT4461376.1 hypothetical protein [archaeon]MBT4858878.1 hypothetical protein [archaeon]MBT5423448.1 hypothetical protein [archaeon]
MVTDIVKTQSRIKKNLNLDDMVFAIAGNSRNNDLFTRFGLDRINPDGFSFSRALTSEWPWNNYKKGEKVTILADVLRRHNPVKPPFLFKKRFPEAPEIWQELFDFYLPDINTAIQQGIDLSKTITYSEAVEAAKKLHEQLPQSYRTAEDFKSTIIKFEQHALETITLQTALSQRRTKWSELRNAIGVTAYDNRKKRSVNWDEIQGIDRRPDELANARAAMQQLERKLKRLQTEYDRIAENGDHEIQKIGTELETLQAKHDALKISYESTQRNLAETNTSLLAQRAKIAENLDQFTEDLRVYALEHLGYTGNVSELVEKFKENRILRTLVDFFEDAYEGLVGDRVVRDRLHETYSEKKYNFLILGKDQENWTNLLHHYTGSDNGVYVFSGEGDQRPPMNYINTFHDVVIVMLDDFDSDDSYYCQLDLDANIDPNIHLIEVGRENDRKKYVLDELMRKSYLQEDAN